MNVNKRLLTVLISALAMSLVVACSTNYANKTSSEVSKNTALKNSEFDSSMNFIGPLIKDSQRRGLFTDEISARLRAAKSKDSGVTTFQIYVSLDYVGEWRYYQSASFVGGEKVVVDKLNSNVACPSFCLYTEVFGIEVSEDYLTDHLSKDLRVRLNSKSGFETMLNIPSSYVEGFYAAVNSQHQL